MHLNFETGLGEDGFNRNFYLRKGKTEIIQEFGNCPTLDDIREAERRHGNPAERIDIFDAGLLCTNCGNPIQDRFSADQEGNLLCWNCASDQTSKEVDQSGVSRATDTTKAILSESNLNHKSLCDYVINVATGCTHGCKFCYVPGTPNITTREDMLKERTGIDDGQQDWGSYLLYRDDLPERLARKLDNKQKWNSSRRGRGVVMLSSGTDCYQDRRTAQITRGCVAELVKHEIPVRILTRSPAVVRDADLFSEYSELVTVGSSIPYLDDGVVKSIEVSAPPPTSRLNALRQLSEQGVRVYVSMSPTYPILDKEDIRSQLEEFKELDPEIVFHEPINPRGGNFEMTIQAARQAGQEELANELERIKSRDEWVKYSRRHLRWVEELGEELGVNVHLWPDKQFINEAAKNGSSLEEINRWKAWRKKASEENFTAARPLA